MDAITTAILGLTNRVTAYRIYQYGAEMDRLTEKLQRAGQVVGRQTAKIEARADSLIAREDAIERRTDEVFTPHETILTTAEKGLQGLEDKLRLMSNDPLLDSAGSQEGQQTVQPPQQPVGSPRETNFSR
jgi:chromosome segregation ATPase